MSKFKNGDKVVPIERDGYKSIDEWVERWSSSCCINFFKENGYLIYKEKGGVGCTDCGSEVWHFDDDELVLYKGESEMFKRENLKDGMVLTLRDGSKLIYLNGYVSELTFVTDKCFNSKNMGKIEQWEEDLTFANNRDYDILKVTYDGEVLFEVKQYMTLKEAIDTGKRFKHKECDTYYNYISYAIEELEDVVAEKIIDSRTTNLKLFEEMNEKVWEVEDNE